MFVWRRDMEQIKVGKKMLETISSRIHFVLFRYFVLIKTVCFPSLRMDGIFIVDCVKSRESFVSDLSFSFYSLGL